MPPHPPPAAPPAIAVLAAALAAAALPAQGDRPVSLPVQAVASVDAGALAATGRATLRLQFVAEEALDRALAVRVELRLRGRMLLRRDHAPPVPTRQWAKGKPVAYELPLAFRTPPAGVAPGDTIDVFVGFVDAVADAVVPPLARDAGRDGLVRLAGFTFDAAVAAPDRAAVEAIVADALARAAREPETAWDLLESAFRRLDDYRLKATLRDALLQVGRTAPPPLSFEEQDIVQGRVRAERARHLREVAGRMYDRGRLLGALLLLDEVGGALQEQADRAVLGALADARRVTQDRDDIAARVFALGDEQQREVERLVTEHANGAERLAVGVELARKRERRAVGRELVRTLEFTPELREQAAAARARIEQAWLADVPADERAEAEAAMAHPCWARTKHRTSHRFVLIGPQQLLDGVPADSLLRFDLAYLYLTDLFGRLPNPDGDRVTVYWKELWDFGGGVGGGKTIDVGRADPAAKQTRADTGLLYHELVHCVDDTAPVYPGFGEGVADFGAAFAQLELGQVAAGRAAVGLALRAFLQDYVERDLEYWRMPNYGPSAGFLLHFATTYGKDGDGYRWEKYRRFFRDYRACPVKDGRTPTLARAFAFHLTEAFGDAAFADLVRFRWPLRPDDLEAVRREQRAASARGGIGPSFDDLPGSPVPRDRVARSLHEAGADLAGHARELGVVTDWWVIGPFRKEGVDPDTFRFPPELEVDLQARYDSINNRPTWRRPGPKPVTVHPTGWLAFDFSYQEDSAIYALTHVTVERDTEAWFHLRADDDVTLFVADELVGKYDFARGRLGPWRPRGDVLLPDAIRFPVRLAAGRTKVLLKIRNGGGPAGCVLAIAQQNGLPLPGWRSDADPPAKRLAAIDAPDGRRWAGRFRARFDSGGAHKKLDATVGDWRVRNGALEGYATAREVEWRKYTVRPGFPKDSPSNLTWLPEKATEQLDAFLLTIELAPGIAAPKACVIVQGDGRRDALCGWTLILEPHRDQVRAHLERYDLRVHSSDLAAWDPAAKKPTLLELHCFARRLTVRLGGQVLFDQAPLLPIPGRHRIGLVTWSDALRVSEIELRAPARTR